METLREQRRQWQITATPEEIELALDYGMLRVLKKIRHEPELLNLFKNYHIYSPEMKNAIIRAITFIKSYGGQLWGKTENSLVNLLSGMAIFFAEVPKILIPREKFDEVSRAFQVGNKNAPEFIKLCVAGEHL